MFFEGDHENTKVHEDHEEENDYYFFFVFLRVLRVFVVAFSCA